MAIFAAALMLALVLILLLAKPSRVLYVKILTVPAFCFAFILCLILLSDTAVKAALNGLKLWGGVVVPSLFPFFVAAEVMNATGFIRAAGILLEPVMRPLFNVPGCGSFAFAMGVTSGYPVGAKITCDFRSSGDLTKTEAERLLAFTNNSGPLFIVGAVGTGMYGSSRLGIFLLVCHFLSSITVGLIFRFYKGGGGRRTSSAISTSGKNLPLHPGKNRPLTANSVSGENRPLTANAANAASAENSPLHSDKNRPLLREFRARLLDGHKNSPNFGTLLGDAVRNSISTILAVGGFIVMFSVIIRILGDMGIIDSVTGALSGVLGSKQTSPAVLKGIVSGIFEITTGSGLVSAVTGISVLQQLPAASFIIGWAGLSVHFQVMSIAAKTDVSIRPYLTGKLLQGIISAFYAWLGVRFFGEEIFPVRPVLNSFTFSPMQWVQTLEASLCILLVVLSFFAAATVLYSITSRFRKKCKGIKTN